jgi:hypothetical protein
MYERDLAVSLASVAARKGNHGFTFDDLARVVEPQRAHISAVADWLARARSTGLVTEMGFDAGLGEDRLGPRRYQLARGGKR